MRATTILTAFFAVAVSAAALPVDTEAAIIEKRGNCDHGYFACVTGQQVFCGFPGTCSTIACNLECIQRINAEFRRWCGQN
ncbi:uncharacterized protein B0J16DRAFT_388821 [Fusarium flagelliforme]|uniref:uncharacterized protein n=1 Tax=Fusarium flagelliforme TaxID=2675880 RepID=UPI001E8CF327|nr:uncharacterized protein B0J16DRAFT_388821 [Fusarium flagelliforme]KAH7174994.1 hypothetical protein B0J16DRAFT_388821 [Fusarium flagelliforme]